MVQVRADHDLWAASSRLTLAVLRYDWPFYLVEQLHRGYVARFLTLDRGQLLAALLLLFPSTVRARGRLYRLFLALGWLVHGTMPMVWAFRREALRGRFSQQLLVPLRALAAHGEVVLVDARSDLVVIYVVIGLSLT